jgi:hypothetical protein
VWRIAVATVAVASVAFPQARSTRATPSCTAQWRVLARPTADLQAVAALSPTNVWALGFTGKEVDRRSVIAHWDEGRFELNTRPKAHSLWGISAVSPTNVWAVGDDEKQALIEHWDGAQWRRLLTPRGVIGLNDIVMNSRTSGWAVGETSEFRPVVLHWNGRFWKKLVLLRRPNEGGLSAVDAASADDIWAVGARGGEHTVNTENAFAVHWNGRRWRVIPAPTRDDSDLGYELSDQFDDVAGASPKEAWAIHSGVVRYDIQRWNGRRWKIVRVFGRGWGLGGVIAFHREAWALGGHSGHPFVLHWNGKAWSEVRRGLADEPGSLLAAAALSRHMIWAAGSHLLARYSC